LLPPFELARRLARSRVLNKLPPEKITLIASRCKQKHFDTNDFFIRHNSTGKQVFILLSGKARAIMISAKGREVGYQDIDTGKMFGELAAIDNLPRSTSVVAVEPSIVAVISQRDFLHMLESDWEITQAVMQHLTRMTRDLCEKVFDYVTLSIRERIYIELIRIAQPFLDDSGQAVITNAPTHTRIANMIGGNREAVTREMNILKSDGLIQPGQNRTLVLTNIEKLEALAGQSTNEKKGNFL